MSANRNYRTKQRLTSGGDRLQVNDAIQRAKNAVLFEHVGRAEEHGRLVRLALNEAEGLAWQTGFPHLVFPELAREKAQAAVAWHRRQRLLRHGPVEVAFAE